MLNHYSKYVDMEDADFSDSRVFKVVKFYIPEELYFECDERLAIKIGLATGRGLKICI